MKGLLVCVGLKIVVYQRAMYGVNICGRLIVLWVKVDMEIVAAVVTTVVTTVVEAAVATGAVEHLQHSS